MIVAGVDTYVGTATYDCGFPKCGQHLQSHRLDSECVILQSDLHQRQEILYCELLTFSWYNLSRKEQDLSSMKKNHIYLFVIIAQSEGMSHHGAHG